MQLAPTDRTRHRRLAERGSFDIELINAIIDEALICHVGFDVDGAPVVIPTIHSRIDDHVYLHGAVGNNMLRSLDRGVDACVTMTIIDGLVLARSAFHHSMNYRSVMLFGRATKVDDTAEKRAAFDALVEHVAAGRMRDARPPRDDEMRKTLLLKLPIREASAKVRAGGPVDDADDMDMPIWAGVLPCTMTFANPAPDAGITAPVPDYVTNYTR